MSRVQILPIARLVRVFLDWDLGRGQIGLAIQERGREHGLEFEMKTKSQDSTNATRLQTGPLG